MKLDGLSAAFHTLGCRVNAYETESMREQLERAGCRIVDFAPGADLYIINTCTVTGIADRKSRQMLHRAREMNPGALVAAVGCYAEDGRSALEKDPAVDLIIGNDGKKDIAGAIAAHLAGRTEEASEENRPDPAGSRISTAFAETPVIMHEGRTRAYIKAEDGCSQFCTYCVIPYVRGRVRSRDPESVAAEAAVLAENGYAEIILTGIHLASYGTDFDGIAYNSMAGKTNARLLDLVERVSRIGGVRRIRFGSLEPGLMTEEFVRALSADEKVCPQFHLSLQSGCDATLKRMNRRYTADEFAAAAERLRRYYEDPAITTDIIAGFPGETEEEFAATKDFVQRMHFAGTHIFPYSRREGTRAAAMPGQVPASVKKARAAELAAIDRKERAEYAARFAGRTVEVLFEERGVCGGVPGMTGHSREMLDVFLPTEEDLAGQIRRLEAVRTAEDGRLIAREI